MNQSETLSKLADALVKAQGEMPEIPMDGINPHFKSKFSTLGAVIKATRPIFSKHGLAVLQLPSGGNGEIGLTTRIVHTSGEWIEQEAKMNVPGGANPGQELGKLVTYLRRYSLAAAAGVYSDEDTDNESAGQKKAEKKDGEIITDDAWKKFSDHLIAAQVAGVEVKEYKRSEMNVEQLRAEYKRLSDLMKKAGA